MIKLNGKHIDYGMFPNKECNMPLFSLEMQTHCQVEWVFEGDEEFFRLALLKKYLDNQDASASLTISYMPHSRMDRYNKSYAFSLKTAAELVNNMGWWAVTVGEPHSDVTPALLDNVHIFNWCEAAIEKAAKMSGCKSLFYPDAGAAKRYPTDIMKYGVGNKLRDFETGTITDYSITGYVGQTVLIVDDMCSRGGTFIEASKQLKKQAGAKHVSLLVAYCESNVFTGELFEHIDILYASKSNLLEPHPQIVLL